MFLWSTDLDVSASFEEEVKLVKTKIAIEINQLDKIKIFSSPLQRCTNFAKKISDNIQIDPRVMELNLGDWEIVKIYSKRVS